MTLNGKAFVVALAIGIGMLAPGAGAVERITVDVVNERAFMLSIELRDMNCGGTVVLREQLQAGERRAVEICASPKGTGSLGVTYGSGCSQVKRTKMRDIEPGAALSF